MADDPDVLIITSDAVSDTSALVTMFPEWRNLKAYRARRIFLIDADIVSRPGPRAVEGLEVLHRIMHAHDRGWMQ